MLPIIVEAFETLSEDDRREILQDSLDTKAEGLISAKLRNRINVLLGGRHAFREVALSRLGCVGNQGNAREQTIDLVVIEGGNIENGALHLIEFKQYYDFDCMRALKPGISPFRDMEKDINQALARLRNSRQDRVRSRHAVMFIIELGNANIGRTYKYDDCRSAGLRALPDLRQRGIRDPMKDYLVNYRRSLSDLDARLPACVESRRIPLGDLNGTPSALFMAVYASA